MNSGRFILSQILDLLHWETLARIDGRLDSRLDRRRVLRVLAENVSGAYVGLWKDEPV